MLLPSVVIGCLRLGLCAMILQRGFRVITMGLLRDSDTTPAGISRAVGPMGLPYELVRAYHPNNRQSRTPHSIATGMLHIWYHADRHEHWKRLT